MICTCIYCGKEFEKKERGRTPIACYDPACREALAEQQAEDNRIRHARAYARKRKAKKLTLSEVADLANKAGMTYGQYVVTMEGGKHGRTD